MRNRSTIALALLTFACSGSSRPLTPGYDGPVPSAIAQDALSRLGGERFEDSATAFGGGRWTVGSFGVVPNPTSGKGPVVRVWRDETEHWIPLETDGDVADFWQRVTGERSRTLFGARSEAYERAVGLR